VKLFCMEQNYGYIFYIFISNTIMNIERKYLSQRLIEIDLAKNHLLVVRVCILLAALHNELTPSK